ncbi:hypothetical protein EJD97_001513, partial [Solanum chilense]
MDKMDGDADETQSQGPPRSVSISQSVRAKGEQKETSEQGRRKGGGWDP